MARPPAVPGAKSPIGVLQSTWSRLVLGLVVLVVVGGAAYGGWYLFLRPAGPAPVNLNSLPSSAASSSAAGRSLDGTWTVNASIGSGSTGSFVGYRVQETLASIGANTAVGRTLKVTGSFTLQGSTITAATINADLTALHSDSPGRDGQLTHRGLETSTYPTATFVLSTPIALGSLPRSSQIVTLSATGRLTLHGQTRTVQITLQGRLSGGVIAVTGSLPITFADYGITPPTSFVALSVQDHGIMELQLMFTHG